MLIENVLRAYSSLQHYITQIWLDSNVGRMLTVEEAQAEYIKTLDNLARTSLFQYTLVLTLYFVVTLPDTSVPVLSFNLALSKIQWVFGGLLALAVLNFYLSRQISYLNILLHMYPSQRRKLRFLTWHHYWLFNPFRAPRLRYSKKSLKSKQLTVFRLRIGKYGWRFLPFNAYRVVSYVPLFYIIFLLADWWKERTGLPHAVSLVNYVLMLLALFAVEAASETNLDSAISKHQWEMWGRKYPYKY